MMRKYLWQNWEDPTRFETQSQEISMEEAKLRMRLEHQRLMYSLPTFWRASDGEDWGPEGEEVTVLAVKSAETPKAFEQYESFRYYDELCQVPENFFQRSKVPLPGYKPMIIDNLDDSPLPPEEECVRLGRRENIWMTYDEVVEKSERRDDWDLKASLLEGFYAIDKWGGPGAAVHIQGDYGQVDRTKLWKLTEGARCQGDQYTGSKSTQQFQQGSIVDIPNGVNDLVKALESNFRLDEDDTDPGIGPNTISIPFDDRTPVPKAKPVRRAVKCYVCSSPNPAVYITNDKTERTRLQSCPDGCVYPEVAE